MKRSLFLIGLLYVCLPAVAEKSPVRTYLEQNSLKEALRICRQIDVLDTRDPDNYVACTWVYYRTGKRDSADRLRQKIRDQKSLEVELLRAYSLMQKKRYYAAQDLLNKLESKAKRKQKLDIQELQAENYELRGQMDAAAFIYKGIVGRDSNRARAHWGLARHYLKRKDHVRAIKHLRQTTKRWPKHVESRLKMARVFFDIGELRRTGKYLYQAYRIDKANPETNEFLGEYFEKKKKLPEAVRYWERAISIDKNRKIAKEKLTGIYTTVIDKALGKDSFETALKYINKSEALNGLDAGLLLRRGIIYRKQGLFEKAKLDLQKYISKDPDDPRALRELGISYLNLKLFVDAEATFRKLIGHEPRGADNHAWLAYVLEIQGKLEPARTSLKKAFKYLKDPKKLKKATRRLATIEKKIRQKQLQKEEE